MLADYDIYKRDRLTLFLSIELLAPLSHISGTHSNLSMLRTEPAIGWDGQPGEAFIYSGNALRNGTILRRGGAVRFLEELGLKVDPDSHHTIFAGGRGGGGGNNMELDARLRQLLPPISVLGTDKDAGLWGEKKAQMIPGRINVGGGYLVCYENGPYITETMPGVLPWEIQEDCIRLNSAFRALSHNPMEVSTAEAIATYQQVKKECLPRIRKFLPRYRQCLATPTHYKTPSLSDPKLQHLLQDAPGAIASGQTGLLGTGKPAPEKKERSSDGDRMLQSDELIAKGNRLISRWDLNCTDVETGWVVDSLLKFAESPYIGGKQNRGHGLVKIDIFYRKAIGQNEDGTVSWETGSFLTIETGQQQISDRAQGYHSEYRDYLGAYREYLEQSSADEVRGLFDGAA